MKITLIALLLVSVTACGLKRDLIRPSDIPPEEQEQAR